MNITGKKQAHKHREQTSGYQWRQGREEGQVGVRGLIGTNYYLQKK